MKVRCESLHLSEEQKHALGIRSPLFNHPSLVVGKEYLALGLSFEADPEYFTTGPYVYVLLDRGDVLQCELGLFTITDPRMSRYWQIQMSMFYGRNFVDILPPPLFSMLTTSEDDTRTGEERDEAYFAALRSSEFKQTYELLAHEFDDVDVALGQ